MKPRFIDPRFGEVTPEILNEIETKYDFIFPSSYFNFLIEENGGVPEPSWFLTKYHGPQNIVTFYGVDKDRTRQPYDLFELIDSFWLENGPYLVPFADDGLGNYYCICVSDANYGKVYFWDNNEYIPDALLEDNPYLILVSDSFEQFLESASECHPDETTFENLLRTKAYDKALDFIHQPEINFQQTDYDDKTMLDKAEDYSWKHHNREHPILIKIIEFLKTNTK